MMEKVKLGDIVKIEPSTHEPSLNNNWLLNLDMVEQQTGKIISYQEVSKDALKGSIVAFDENNVLYSKLRPNLNKVVCPNREGYATSEMLPLKIINSQLSREYLTYFLRSTPFVTWAMNRTAGAKMPRLSTKELLNKDIPVVSVEKQNEIVQQFDLIERTLELSHERLTTLDTLIKSRFVEMFGDPVLNPKGWEIKEVKDIVNDVRYGTSNKANINGKYKYLRMNNLTYDGYLDLTDLKRIDIPDAELEKCVVHNGDVLFNRTNSRELVGKTALFNLDENMVIAGYIIRIRLKENVLPIFFTRYMNLDFMKKKLLSMGKGAVNQANINAQELQSIKIYVPPIELQNQFAEFVQQVDQAKQSVSASIETLQTLKASLMQKYFH